MRQPVAWVKIMVESVEFADGPAWDADRAPALEDLPALPAK
ncbi:MAG TPA: hypothetical protein VKV17_04095 [Bryobacteraceae bacterium]|nr:hypothetical protein [Bryobacteraceae bacterium]